VIGEWMNEWMNGHGGLLEVRWSKPTVVPVCPPHIQHELTPRSKPRRREERTSNRLLHVTALFAFLPNELAHEIYRTYAGLEHFFAFASSRQQQYRKVYLRHRDLLNWRTCLSKKHIFRKIMTRHWWHSAYFLLIHSKKIIFSPPPPKKKDC